MNFVTNLLLPTILDLVRIPSPKLSMLRIEKGMIEAIRLIAQNDGYGKKEL